MRLGFTIRSIAHPELKSHDARRWQNSPHLSVSLAYLRDMFQYLVRQRISMYRMSCDLAPYATHPDMPQFHGQMAECAAELAAAGQMAHAAGLRLSFHPAQHVVLNSPDRSLVARSAADLASQAQILDAMGLGPEAVAVVHLGGIYEDREAARLRFVENYAALPAETRRRLALENDDGRFGVADTLWVHERTGIPLVFDYLHHRLNNPGRLPLREALAACLRTWPAGVRPKIHYQQPTHRADRRAGGRAGDTRVRSPQWRNHADYVNPFEFIDFLRQVEGLPAFRHHARSKGQGRRPAAATPRPAALRTGSRRSGRARSGAGCIHPDGAEQGPATARDPGTDWTWWMSQIADEAGEAPVLVVVVNDPVDLRRARNEGWYRIPLAHAPARVAAEYLAFYQTGAFPAGERWAVRWYAPVRSYRLTSRRELIPGEPDHPQRRSGLLPHCAGPPGATGAAGTQPASAAHHLHPDHAGAAAAARKRSTTSGSRARPRNGCGRRSNRPAAKPRGNIRCARICPSTWSISQCSARSRRAGLIVEDEPREGSVMREIAAPDYLLVSGAWHGLRLSRAEIEGNPARWAARLAHLVAEAPARLPETARRT